MKNIIPFIIYFLLPLLVYSQSTMDYPDNVSKLIKAYPETIRSFDGKDIILSNGSKIKYTTSTKKLTHQELIASKNLNDIFAYPYTKGEIDTPQKNYDPGRIRNDELLKNMYGSSSDEVQKNLVTIIWCPKLVNQKLKVTSVNGVAQQLQKISDELDNHPELKDYLKSAGTFNWRKVRGADRLSSHSLGIAIDLNVKYSNFWQWDCRCRDESKELEYRNQIPQLIVDVFEKHGFIWGGKWYHYDTMHFEYRPELLLD